jgi:hypothetical protein
MDHNSSLDRYLYMTFVVANHVGIPFSHLRLHVFLHLLPDEISLPTLS